MAALTWLDGSLSASTSNSTADFISQVGVEGATWRSSRPVEVFAIDGDTFARSAGGLYSWTIDFPFKFPATPQHGLSGSLTQSGSGLYLAGVKAFTINLSVAYTPAPDFTDTAGMSMARSDVIVGSGSYTCNVESGTALKAPNVGDTATFTIGEESTNDDILTGAILVNDVSSVRQRGSVTEVTYSFDFNGAITIDGDNGLFTVGTPGTPENLPAPAFDTVTVTNGSGKTVTGSAAWSNISISRDTQSVISGSATLQGSGDVTIA